MNQSEKIIVELLKGGNEKAYKYIYDNHYVLLCQVATQFVKDDFVAETIVGDVIVHLWEVRENITISSSIRSYLLVSVRNRCLDYLKMVNGRREVSFSDLENESFFDYEDSYPLGKLLERELENEIHKSIENLPKECKRVFYKSRFEGKKYEEISTDLGISVQTVKYHIKNALYILRRDLNKYITIFILCLFSHNS